MEQAYRRRRPQSAASARHQQQVQPVLLRQASTSAAPLHTQLLRSVSLGPSAGKVGKRPMSAQVRRSHSHTHTHSQQRLRSGKPHSRPASPSQPSWLPLGHKSYFGASAAAARPQSAASHSANGCGSAGSRSAVVQRRDMQRPRVLLASEQKESCGLEGEGVVLLSTEPARRSPEPHRMTSRSPLSRPQSSHSAHTRNRPGSAGAGAGAFAGAGGGMREVMHMGAGAGAGPPLERMATGGSGSGSSSSGGSGDGVDETALGLVICSLREELDRTLGRLEHSQTELLEAESGRKDAELQLKASQRKNKDLQDVIIRLNALKAAAVYREATTSDGSMEKAELLAQLARARSHTQSVQAHLQQELREAIQVAVEANTERDAMAERLAAALARSAVDAEEMRGLRERDAVLVARVKRAEEGREGRNGQMLHIKHQLEAVQQAHSECAAWKDDNVRLEALTVSHRKKLRAAALRIDELEARVRERDRAIGKLEHLKVDIEVTNTELKQTMAKLSAKSLECSRLSVEKMQQGTPNANAQQPAPAAEVQTPNGEAAAATTPTAPAANTTTGDEELLIAAIKSEEAMATQQAADAQNQ